MGFLINHFSLLKDDMEQQYHFSGVRRMVPTTLGIVTEQFWEALNETAAGRPSEGQKWQQNWLLIQSILDLIWCYCVVQIQVQSCKQRLPHCKVLTETLLISKWCWIKCFFSSHRKYLIRPRSHILWNVIKTVVYLLHIFLFHIYVKLNHL